jgi:hypothetical protein
MATRNGERFLRQQLASIAAQTLPPLELVVVDDASSDSTRSILDTFGTASGWPVRVFQNAHRLGAAKTFELAVGLCRGDVIALADQDDWWHSDKLAVLCDELARPPAALLVFSDARLVDEHGTDLGRSLWGSLGLDPGMLDHLAGPHALGALLGNNLVTGASAAFRSELRGCALPFPSHLPSHIHDGWLAATAAVAGRLRPARHVLMDYRVHPDQLIGVPEVAYAAPGGLLARGRTGPDFSTHLAVARAVSDRLASLPADVLGAGSSPQAVADDLVRHLDVRSSLPSGLLPRAVAVGREVARGGYHRWARGALTAVKDVAALATTVRA